MARGLAARTRATADADIRHLLARDDLDAVSICTPDGLHRAPCEAAARAGKHVLVDKPIATTLADAEGIAGTAERSGVVLLVVLVGPCLRFDARYDAVEQAAAGPGPRPRGRRSSTPGAGRLSRRPARPRPARSRLASE